MDTSWAIGIITSLVSIAGTVGAMYLTFRRKIGTIRQQERGYLETEYARQLERSNGEIDRLRTELAEQSDRIQTLQNEHIQCLRDNASLGAKITVLTFKVEQLQMMAATPGVSVMTNITADLSGTIVDADDSVKAVLGWRAAELIGQNVDKIIPRDLRTRHHGGIERARTSGMVRPPEMAIQSFALTKENERIPVIVSLNGWIDETNRKLVTAQIIHRRVYTVVGETPSGTHQSLPPTEPPKSDAKPESGVFRRKDAGAS